MDKHENRSTSDRLVFCSSNKAHLAWVTSALDEWQVLSKELINLNDLALHMPDVFPRLIFLDFSGNGGNSISDHASDMRQFVQLLKKTVPNVPLIAIGSMLSPEGTVAAMRAGINHFIDMSASVNEAQEVVRKLLAMKPADEATLGSVITLLGARAGIGTTTLAVHLADTLQRYKPVPNKQRRIGLLDLGFPIGDAQLYLNTSGNFNFSEVVRNRHRMDQTLIHTALASSKSGLKIVSLPRELSEMKDISNADVLALLARLRRYFDVLIVDLGANPDKDFVKNIVQASDKACFVTDQSAGSLISLAAMLNTMEDQDGKTNRRLIVNRYDKQFGMSAEQIAERFGLPLAGVLPERTLKLMSCINQGKLLHELNHHDAYVTVIEDLVKKILNIDDSERRNSSFLSRLTSRNAKR